MSDLPNNQTNGNQAPVQAPSNSIPSNNPTQAAPVTSSPWEDELDLPETSPKTGPTVIGSLDPKDKNIEAAQAVPFNVPQNIEEKVGQKVPAGNYIASSGTIGQPMPANIPATSPSAVSVVPTPTANPNIPAAPATKRNIFSSILGKFSRKNKPLPVQNQPASPVAPVSANASPEVKNISNRFAFLNNRKLLAVLGVIVIFAFLVGLTELGLVSVGVEKIYGAVGLEKLWGGLSTNPEQSFAMSALQMQKHPNFKIKGTITMSVDSSIKSDITSPLVSMATGKNVFAKKDENMSSSTKAVKTATDSGTGSIYDMYDIGAGAGSSADTSGSSDSTSMDPSSTTSDGSSTSTDSTSSDSGATGTGTSSNTANSSGVDSSSSSSTSTETSNIQQVKATFQTDSNKDGLQTSLDLSNDTQSAQIDLMLKGGNLLVKSDTFTFSDNQVSDKWLSYTLGKLEGKSLQSDFFAVDAKSGMSIKGKRSSNEKVGSTRCYRYKIDSVEIGDALSPIGITSDMVQNISGDIWVGINDKLIRKIDLKIITPVSSSVSSMEVAAEFSDFDLDNKITFPDSSEVVKAGAAASSSSTNSNASNTSSSQLTTATGRDTQRKTDVTSILDALKKYKTDNGSYPLSSSLLKLNTTDNIIRSALVPKYLSAWPLDPTDGWYYAYKSDGTKCSISARLENTSDAEAQLIGGVYLYLKYNNN